MSGPDFSLLYSLIFIIFESKGKYPTNKHRKRKGIIMPYPQGQKEKVNSIYLTPNMICFYTMNRVISWTKRNKTHLNAI